MDIIGQERLIKKLTSYSYQTLPKTLLLIGEHGCGKQKMAEFIAAHFDIELINIEPNVEADTLIEYYQSPARALYVIDLTAFSERAQNRILKFIEEPSPTSNILLLTDSEVSVIPTVLNRCIKLYFDTYSEEELEKYKKFNNKLIYKLCRTPGQLDEVDNTNIDDLVNFCNKFIDRIDKASYANALKVSTELNYKEDYNKFNLNLFFNTVLYCAQAKYREIADKKYLIIYNITNKYITLISNKTLVKENVVLSYLTDIWEAVVA